MLTYKTVATLLSLPQRTQPALLRDLASLLLGHVVPLMVFVDQTQLIALSMGVVKSHSVHVIL